MNVTAQFIIYLTVLLFALLCALRRFRQQERSLKIIALWLIVTVISESLAAFMSRYYQNNMPVYHFYAPVSLLLIALYYHYSIPVFQRYHIGYIIGIAGIIAAIINTVFIQPLTSLDSNLMLFSGICITTMALFAFYAMFTDDTGLPLTGNIHFWISFLFLFYWCGTFLIWAFLQVLIILKEHEAIKPVYLMLWAINLVKYSGMGMAFLILSTKKTAYEKSKSFS
ncbi:MAG: hypothetical protein EPN39_19425 [Chitinophagaceae bacterium]|nr:MAG: hypothetical protein EPN39_19425 [Chitinophagaceae bacterium]